MAPCSSTRSATSGAVLINGVDVREAAPEHLWERIGLVPQRPFLFSGTVGSNLRFAHEDAPARRLFETSITVEGPADRPRILLDAQPLAWTSLDDHLAPRHPARSPNDH